MAKCGLLKTINGKPVHKWYALFIVEENYPFLRRDKIQLPYFLVAN